MPKTPPVFSDSTQTGIRVVQRAFGRRNNEAVRYLMRFHIGGLMAIIDEWTKGDCEDSIEQVVSVMQQCVKRAS